MDKIKKTCKYCGLEFEGYKNGPNECDKCISLVQLNEFVAKYDNNHVEKVLKNKIHNKNLIKENYDHGNGVTFYTLAKHSSTYRIVKRTKRVQIVIDKISFIREYLYFNLQPVFEILDSIYINRDQFWADSGNLVRYVHNCCFQEAVLKLCELLMDGSCKYSVKKICNTLLADSKYVFKEQEIYEQLEFEESKDVMEERFEPFDISEFVELINNALDANKALLEAMKDYRDNQFAHIGNLKKENSSKQMSYVNVKRMFSLAKIIYDAFLFVVAPDKYASIIFDSNICFIHLNELSKVYKQYQEEERKRVEEEIARFLQNK